MEENRLIYDHLQTKGLSSDRLYKGVNKLSLAELVDLSSTLNSFIKIDENIARTNFDFIANASLSGLPGQCGNIRCRRKNVNQLIRKSALYANKVWVKNPLERHEHLKTGKVDIDVAREGVIEDLQIIYDYRDLIENGIFSFAKTEKHFCYNCFGSLTDQVDWPLVSKVENLKKDLIERFSKGAKYSLVKIPKSKKYKLYIKAIDKDLFEHEGLYYGINNVKSEFPKALNSSKLKVKRYEIKESKQINYLVNKVIDNIVMQNWYAQHCNANYLSNTPIELSAIQSINSAEVNLNSNKIYDSLSHVLPIIDDIRVEKLMELRENEPEAFLNYRNTLDKVLREHSDKDEKELKEIFRDLIEPEIDQMNQTINLNKKKLYKDTIHSIGTGSFLVGVSLFTGLLPTGISQGMAGLALYHQGKEVINNAKKIIGKEYEMKDHKFHFLWKTIN